MAVELTGNVGQKPELIITPGGSKVCQFSVAIDGGKEPETGEKVTTWVRVACFKEVAEQVEAEVNKGDRLWCRGNLKLDEFTRKDGTAGAAIRMAAFEVTKVLRGKDERVPLVTAEGKAEAETPTPATASKR